MLRFHLSLWKITKPFDSYLIQTGPSSTRETERHVNSLEWVLQVSEWKMEVPAGDFEEEATVGSRGGIFDIETGWNHQPVCVVKFRPFSHHFWT